MSTPTTLSVEYSILNDDAPLLTLETLPLGLVAQGGYIDRGHKRGRGGEEKEKGGEGRESGGEGEGGRRGEGGTYVCIYIYIYIHMYIEDLILGLM